VFSRKATPQSGAGLPTSFRWSPNTRLSAKPAKRVGHLDPLVGRQRAFRDGSALPNQSIRGCAKKPRAWPPPQGTRLGFFTSHRYEAYPNSDAQNRRLAKARNDNLRWQAHYLG
jgi:hypothetical protein